ncbi:D-glycero-beta-D-manno-heptose-1,7-bisphosphate 7-phosphatase [archaeon]|nr:D-glycero-beta-D-manno-heptose-1,7-bisphosphate 7-phosphatase [archaeon]
MKKVIFLDRDGTINEDSGFVYKIEDFKFLPKVIDSLKLLSKENFKFIIVTNQSGIGRGYYTEEDFLRFNNHIVNELLKDGIKIEKTYYCPHHPEHGVGEYKMDCTCRKPKTGLVIKAKEEFGINLLESIMIGDHPGDVEMGKKAGCKTIYVLTGHGKRHEVDSKEVNFIAKDLYEAAKWILNNK